MGFSERELVNINSAALQANTLDANASAVWYEKVLAFQFVLPSSKIWTNVAGIPVADTLAQARANAAANPTVIQDLSQNASAVRLAEVPGTNKSTWACYGIVGGVPTPGQPITANWILPQLIANSSGNPSNGYSIRLYNGDPASGGVIVNPGDGQTGSGEDKSVGWVFNYASGSLLLSSDFYSRTGINSNTFDPYIVGFRYIGTTAGSGGGGGGSSDKVTRSITLGETVTAGQVIRLATSSDAPITVGTGMKALATTGDNINALGVADSGGNSGDDINIVLFGVRDLTFSVAPTTAQIGADVFLDSVTSGSVSLTAPSNSGTSIIKIGKLLDADGLSLVQPCKIDVQFVVGIS